MVERRGEEVHQEAENKDGGWKRWRRSGKHWKMIEGIRDRGEHPPTGLGHLYGQKKKAARRVVDSTEEYGGRTVPKA